jgi:hypothetical protein
MAKNYDDTLRELAGRANEVLNSGDAQRISEFDSTLKGMASASNTDANSRQAALQLRLPDVNVGRGEEGQLAFSRPSSFNPTIPREFAAKAKVLKPGETIIVGDQTGVGILTSRARQTTEAIVGRQLAGIGDAATSPSIKGIAAQLNSIDGLDDPIEKQKAFLQLSSSIELAKSSRAIELTTLKEREFGVPNLEAQLRAEEAADRTDPKWLENQVDSAITSQIRSRLRTAKADAYTFAQRDLAVDPVLAEMTGRINELTGKIQLEAGQTTAKDKEQEKVYDALFPQARDKMKAFASLASGQPMDTINKETVLKHLNNPDAGTILSMSPKELLGASANKAEPNAELYRDIVERMGIIKDAEAVDKYMQGVNQVLSLPTKDGAVAEEALDKLDPRLKQMASDPRLLDIVRRDTAITSGMVQASVAERASRAKERNEEVAELAIRFMMEDEMHGLNIRPIALPPAPSPLLTPLIEEAKSNELGIDGILEGRAIEGLLSTDDPQALQSNIDMVTQYVINLYRSNGPAPVLDIDVIGGIERQVRQRLQAKAAGLHFGRGPLDIMSNTFVWNWPGNMVGESLNAIERAVSVDSAYARRIAETPVTGAALRLAQSRQEGQ